MLIPQPKVPPRHSHCIAVKTLAASLTSQWVTHTSPLALVQQHKKRDLPWPSWVHDQAVNSPCPKTAQLTQNQCTRHPTPKSLSQSQAGPSPARSCSIHRLQHPRWKCECGRDVGCAAHPVHQHRQRCLQNASRSRAGHHRVYCLLCHPGLVQRSALSLMILSLASSSPRRPKPRTTSSSLRVYSLDTIVGEEARKTEWSVSGTCVNGTNPEFAFRLTRTEDWHIGDGSRLYVLKLCVFEAHIAYAMLSPPRRWALRLRAT